MKIKTLILLSLCCGLATMSIAQCPMTSIILDSQAAIDNFATDYPGCTAIPTGINLRIDEAIPSTITNLDGLNQITSLGGNLVIYGNFALTNVNGLSQLTSIGGYIDISDNNVLTNVDGLGQITSVENSIFISYNDALTELNGLNQITSIEKNLYIRSNSSLSNLDGLSQLSSVGENFWIVDNYGLTNVDGLNQLTSVGGVFQIAYNPQLNQCCALCPLFSADAADSTVIGGAIYISDNLTGCNSEAEITACNPCGLVNTSIPEQDLTQLNIYPNPAQNILHFQYESIKDELVNFTIKNYLGQQFIQGKVYTNQPVEIDISGYPTGVYVLKVLQDGKPISRLFSVCR